MRSSRRDKPEPDTAQANEAAVVAAIGNDGFSELGDDVSDWLVGFVADLAGGRKSRDDIAASAILGIAKAAKRRTTVGNLTSFTLTLLSRRGTDMFRSDARWSARLDNSVDPEQRASDITVMDDVLQREQGAALKQAVAHLSDVDRAIVMQRASDIDYSDIAAGLGISEDSARKRHQRAIQRLQVMLLAA